MSDLEVLRVLAEKLGIRWPSGWVEWTTPKPQKERKQLHLAFSEEITGLITISLRDRDDEPSDTADLWDSATTSSDQFLARRWRRRYIESYLVWPEAIAAATGATVSLVETLLAEHHGIAVPHTFARSDVPAAIMDVRAKGMFRNGSVAVFSQFNASPVEVARAIPPEAIPDDIRTFLRTLADKSA